MTAFDTAVALLGRLHPMVLHLPIGLIGAMVLLEAWRLLRREREMAEALLPIAWLNALTGATAALSGLALAEEGGSAGEALDRHRMLGIVMGIACVALAIVVTVALRRRSTASAAAYRGALAVVALLLVPVGHLGATLTHGEGFLTAPLRERGGTSDIATVAATPDDGLPAAVRAVLTDRCVACHGAVRTKGLLSLHTRAAIDAGGETGPIVTWGKPEESPIYQRLLLPLDHDDRMPPKEKPQPSDAEIETIRAWIASGGTLPANENDGEGEAPDATLAATEPAPAPAAAPARPVADAKAVEALRAKLVHVQPVSADSSLLWIDFAAAQGTDDATVAPLLDPLRAFVGDLNLSRTAITDQTLQLVAAMPSLRRLDLRGTAIGDQGIAQLAGHASLEELVLVGTKVTEAALVPIRSMPKLARLFLWNTAIPRDQLVVLRAERPTLIADADETTVAAAIEVEPVPAFTNDAPLPGATAPTTVATAIVAINAVCPVSGAAVNPTYTIVWEGKPVGFCCEKCAAQFWAEPARFAGAIKPK